MSAQPADSPRFREGLEWEWRNMDVFAEEKIDRGNPDFSKYMSSETKEGQKRVCWNSWIAPHNFEKIYANAKLSRDYNNWKFQDVFEDRVKQAQSNVAVFNAPNETSKTKMMINSEFSCMGCHQQ